MKRGAPQHGFGRVLTKDEWVQLAVGAVFSFVDERLAVAHSELEAALSERGVRPRPAARVIEAVSDLDKPWPEPSKSTKVVRFDPHILTEATRELIGLGLIERVMHTTKGRKSVELLVPADQVNRSAEIMKALRRKGMLVARINTLTAQLGDAGERIVRHSLSTAGQHISPEKPGFGEVHTFLNVRLRGPLDSAAWVQTPDTESGLRSLSAVPIEVKNRQMTIYPIHKEIHQLLHKAATLQAAHPGQPIVPVLICRRAHQRLFWMAKNLGFQVTEFTDHSQYVVPTKNIDTRKINEIRNELGLPYLTILPEPLPRMRLFFEETLPTRAPKVASRWAITAATVLPYSERLRREGPDSAERLDAIRDLRQEIEVLFGDSGIDEDVLSWSLPDLDEI